MSTTDTVTRIISVNCVQMYYNQCVGFCYPDGFIFPSRYYLEPASPLKSLPTNASSSLTSLSGGSNKNANESLVPLKTPTLTPPATLRLNRTNSGSCNGLNNVNASSSSLPGAIGGGTQFQQQFTPDDSGFFSADPPKILPPTPQKSHILQRKNGIKMKQHPVNGLPATYGRNQKNGLLNNSSATGLSGSSGDINANKFTPDADFVADFGSATIVNNVSNGGSHYGSTSSLKNSNAVSDNGTGLYAQHNGNNGEVSAREMENFADFDHNPIFNSAGNGNIICGRIFGTTALFRLGYRVTLENLGAKWDRFSLSQIDVLRFLILNYIGTLR